MCGQIARKFFLRYCAKIICYDTPKRPAINTCRSEPLLVIFRKRKYFKKETKVYEIVKIRVKSPKLPSNHNTVHVLLLLLE